MADIPYIDPAIQHVGTSRLRTMNATYLRLLDHPLVIRDGDTPLAVLVPYAQFMKIQSLIVAAMNREVR